MNSPINANILPLIFGLFLILLSEIMPRIIDIKSRIIVRTIPTRTEYKNKIKPLNVFSPIIET